VNEGQREQGGYKGNKVREKEKNAIKTKIYLHNYKFICNFAADLNIYAICKQLNKHK
jgi:hypothetical protein